MPATLDELIAKPQQAPTLDELAGAQKPMTLDELGGRPFVESVNVLERLPVERAKIEEQKKQVAAGEPLGLEYAYSQPEFFADPSGFDLPRPKRTGQTQFLADINWAEHRTNLAPELKQNFIQARTLQRQKEVIGELHDQIQSRYDMGVYQGELEKQTGKFWTKTGKRWERGKLQLAGGLAHLAGDVTRVATAGKYGKTADDWARMFWDVQQKAPEYAALEETLIDKYFGSAVETAPFMLAAMAPAAMTGGATIPSTLGSFLVSYGVEGNTSYQSAKDRGASERDARIRGVVVGMINGGIEVAGGGGGKYFKNRAIAATMTKLQKVKHFGKHALTNALREGLAEELPQEAVQIVAGGDVPHKADGSVDYGMIAKRLVDSAVMGTMLGGIMDPSITGAKYLATYRRKALGEIPPVQKPGEPALSPEEYESQRYNLLLERAGAGDRAAIDSLNEMQQGAALPTYEDLLDRISQGDLSAAEEIQAGRYYTGARPTGATVSQIVQPEGVPGAEAARIQPGAVKKPPLKAKIVAPKPVGLQTPPTPTVTTPQAVSPIETVAKPTNLTEIKSRLDTAYNKRNAKEFQRIIKEELAPLPASFEKNSTQGMAEVALMHLKEQAPAPVAEKAEQPSYGMAHRPSYEGMPPAHNLLEGDAIPKDVYEHPEWSIASGRNLSADKAAKESWDVLRKIRGHPEAEVTVYRATPKKELNTGDWVTFSKEYAKQSLEPKSAEKVYSFKVKAKDVFFAGDDINEFGYYPGKQVSPAPAAEKAVKQAPAPEGKAYGAENKGVTQAEYDEIKKRQAKDKGKLKGGREAGGTILFNPQEWSDAVKIGMYHLEAGARAFKEWSAKMIGDFGEDISPHLDKLWATIRPTEPPTRDSATAFGTPILAKPIPGGKERGFITSVKEQFPDLEMRIAGQYIPRSTDELGMKAANLVKDDIDAAENLVKKGMDDKAVATAAELIKHYSETRQWQRAADVAHEIAPKLTEAGRTVQAAYLLSLQTPEGLLRFAAREIEKYNEQIKKRRGNLLGLKKPVPNLTPQQTKEILTEAEKVKKMPDGPGKARAWQKVQERIDKLIPSTFWDKIVAVRNAGLLTGIKTSGLNITANLAHGISEIAADVPGSMVDSVVSLFTGERALVFTVRGTGRGGIKGAKTGWDYLTTGFDERNIGAKLDYKKTNWGKNPIWRALGAYTDATFRLMGAEDQMFYYTALARSLNSQAMAQAKNANLRGKAAKTFIEKLIAAPTNEMMEPAILEAQTAVFQNHTLIGDLGTTIRKMPGGKWMLPFVRTPAAVAMQIINYSPVGGVRTILENIGRGRFDQRAFSKGMGRSILGTVPLVIGGALLKAGLMALDRPKTERERELWAVEGRQANSIKINGKWRRANILGPVGGVLLLGGHFQRALQETGSPSAAMLKAATAMSKSFSEETFLTGFRQVLDIFQDPTRYGVSTFNNLAGSLVPTLVADIARASDSVERRATTALGAMKARIPGLRQTLPPRVTIFGQDLPRYGGNILEVMADPTRPAKINQDIVIDEMRRLWGNDVKVSPTLLGDKQGYKNLTPDENTRLWRRAGELTYGKLFQIVTAPNYPRLKDKDKGQAVEKITQVMKDFARAELAVQILLNEPAATRIKRYKELRDGGLVTQDIEDLIKKYF